MVLSLLLWQAVGVLGPSMILRDTHLSFDRYFLPLLPLAICLALWSLHEVKLNLPIAVFATAGLALVSVAGTHDFLAYQSTTWQVARKAHEAGVPYDRLDAGAAWDGDHLYERSSKSPQTVGPPETVSPGPFFAGPALLSEHDVGAWWIVYYAPSLRDEYIVSAEPLFGFTVVRRAEYSSWLQGAPTFIYLLRRPDEP